MAVDLSKMSKLGFGLMRLPQKNGEIDMDHVCRMVDRYMASGMNYFDTAYIYHGGKSESAAGEALVKRYPREDFMLATKLPVWEMRKKEDADRILDEQLRRAGVSRFDFYLLHSIEEGSNYENYEKYDCFSWGIRKKEEGTIGHFGFSFHGSPKLLEEVLDRHPETEFVQIQLNYADWNNPVVHSGELYEILLRRNIPIIVMEPVKGGTLAKLHPELEKKFRSQRPDSSIASWALRYVASLPGVMTVLSGMSDDSQMDDNIATFKNFEPLSEKEKALVEEVRDIMLSIPLIGCTSCRYCCDGCPARISIPDVISALNTVKLYNEEFRPRMFYNGLVQSSGKASSCVECGQCEKICPQHLPIIKLMKEAAKTFEV